MNTLEYYFYLENTILNYISYKNDNNNIYIELNSKKNSDIFIINHNKNECIINYNYDKKYILKNNKVINKEKCVVFTHNIKYIFLDIQLIINLPMYIENAINIYGNTYEFIVFYPDRFNFTLFTFKKISKNEFIQIYPVNRRLIYENNILKEGNDTLTHITYKKIERN